MSKSQTPDGTDAADTDAPVHVDGEAGLDALVDEHDVVLVDFHADWCGPCRMLEPEVEQVAAETDAVVAKIDVDDHQLLASQYGVQGVPTMVLFWNGEPAEHVVGYRPADALKDLVADLGA